MRTLGELLNGLETLAEVRTRSVDRALPVTGIATDSRRVRPGNLFVALRGSASDGHAYLEQAVDRGCAALVVEKRGHLQETDLPVIQVDDSRRALGHLAAAWYGHPARRLTLIGLTGTNGKTTTAAFIESILARAGHRVGVLGTVNYRYPDSQDRPVIVPPSLTTPEPLQLQKLLRRMADSGVTHVVMEVSSHALVQHRLAGMQCAVAVFTNLSRDHLDYHHSMEEYFSAKEKLFTRHLQPDGRAVVVVGEIDALAWGFRLAEKLGPRQVLTCGFDKVCRVRMTAFHEDINGIAGQVQGMGQVIPVRSSLIGRYNGLNIVTAATCGLALGIGPDAIRQGIAAVQRVAGRLERVRLTGDHGGRPAVFVDYAHTPDALENMLATVRSLAPGRLVVVFGCGGDRDQGKRPLMGAVAARYGDVVVVTSDNPRTEDPEKIIAAIVPGIRKSGLEKQDLEVLLAADNQSGYAECVDRSLAITKVCALARQKDTVVIAGKGHEAYQICGSKRLDFSDHAEARAGLLRWNIPRLLAASGGSLVQGGAPRLLSDRVVTDSRTIGAGDIFVALTGERFDGHDYLGAACQGGAQVCIVDRPVALPAPEVTVILVENTTRALGDLARYRRRLLANGLQVIGITGSCGKTTVKEMVAAILSVAHGEETVLKTRGNFNNRIGMPLSLLPVQQEHRVAVLEMGMNHPGEIAALTAIGEPDIGCITNVQPAHLEGLGSLQGVARAKGELFAGMDPAALRVVNLDDPLVRSLVDGQDVSCIGYAVTQAGRRYGPRVRATRIVSLQAAGMRFTLHIDEARRRLEVPVHGVHGVQNCVAAAAVAFAAGADLETIARGLTRLQPVDKRMEIGRIACGVRVVNDCYNANPASMAAALQTMADLAAGGKRMALLGDMLELGASATQAHARLGGLVAELGYDFLGILGAHGPTVARAAREGGMVPEQVHWFGDHAAMASWLFGLLVTGVLGKDDWLLLKGSRGMRMERVLDHLEHLFALQFGEEDSRAL